MIEVNATEICRLIDIEPQALNAPNFQRDPSIVPSRSDPRPAMLAAPLKGATRGKPVGFLFSLPDLPKLCAVARYVIVLLHSFCP